MRLWLVVLLIACGGGHATPDAPIGEDVASFGNPLDNIGAVELVASGFQFVEGPQWRDGTAELVFSDVPANTIFRYTGSGAPTVFRMPSGNSNGLALDPTGALLAAEHGTRSLSRDATLVADRFEGKRLNSPNDLIAAADGTIYFTDPPFGIPDAQRELDFVGVFRLAATGTLIAEHRGALAERPNGIGLAPDGRQLYVGYSETGTLFRFPVFGSGALGPREVYAQTAGDADGLAIDIAGNVFSTSSAGIEAFAPDGTKWGVITVPEQPANCAFGDADHRTLYITARTSLYRVRLAHAGLP